MIVYRFRGSAFGGLRFVICFIGIYVFAILNLFSGIF